MREHSSARAFGTHWCAEQKPRAAALYLNASASYPGGAGLGIDLLAPFHAAMKPRSRWRIGTEAEKPSLRARYFGPVPL